MRAFRIQLRATLIRLPLSQRCRAITQATYNHHNLKHLSKHDEPHSTKPSAAGPSQIQATTTEASSLGSNVGSSDAQETISKDYLSQMFPTPGKDDRTAEVRERISNQPFIAGELIRKHLAGGSATYSLLREAMRAAYFPFHQVSWEDRKRVMQRSPIATPIIEHVSRDQVLWQRLLAQPGWAQFMEHLVYFAALEGHSVLMEQWMKSQLQPDAPISRQEWQHTLLRKLVKAHLSHDYGRSADAALRCFHDVHGWNIRSHTYKPQDYPGDSNRRVPTFSVYAVPAARSLVFALRSTKYPQTDPALYDEFAAFCNSFERQFDCSTQNWTAALFSLFHPARPCSQEAIKLYREAMGTTLSTAGQFAAESPRAKDRLFHARCLLRARDLVSKSADSIDRAWLDQAIKYFSDAGFEPESTRAPSRDETEERRRT